MKSKKNKEPAIIAVPKEGIEIGMNEVPFYFSKMRREDLCSSCRCEHLVNKPNGENRVIFACEEYRDNFDCVKFCADFKAVLTKEEEDFFIKEKERLDD